MTVINPPGFLQNAGATHTAEQMRNWFGIRGAGMSAATTLLPRGGVHPGLGNELQVTQSGAPAMSVVVKSGMASIPGTENALQGSYSGMNDADLTVTITAAHATLNRIDRIVFKVEDSAYSGANNISSIVCVTGTPAASPVAPTAPANSITLATVSIVANDTSITNGEITDTRFYYAATGGVINCLSSARPASGTVNDGQLIYETDTDRLLITHDAGANWVIFVSAGWIPYTPTLTALSVNPTNYTATGRYSRMGSTLFVSFAVTAGGAFTAGSGDYAVSLPLTVLAGSTAGSARLFDSSTGNAYVGARVAATTGTTVGFQITPTFLGALGNVAHIFPWTWATGDIIDGFVTCELA